MSKKSFRIGLGIVLATLVLLLVGGGFLWKKMEKYPDRKMQGDGRDVQVIIPKGASFPEIARILDSKGVIDQPSWFRVYGMREGVTNKVRSGTYTLRDNMSPKEVLKILLEGVKEKTETITIPEGLNMLEVFERFEAAGIANKQGLEALARDTRFLRNNGISGTTVEGYLFPETYRFTVPTSPKKVLKILIGQFQKVWSRIRRENDRALQRVKKKLSWSDYDILIMASIVEKEAVLKSEQSRIAQVFMNRLLSPTFKPHRLDTDPTIRYGCLVPKVKSPACQKWDSKGRLRRAQLTDSENPYNTYRHEGLPPGPICSPGEAALRATVHPDGSKYFFFVATEKNGAHAFSRTRAEHERKVDRFQR